MVDGQVDLENGIHSERHHPQRNYKKLGNNIDNNGPDKGISSTITQ